MKMNPRFAETPFGFLRVIDDRGAAIIGPIADRITARYRCSDFEVDSILEIIRDESEAYETEMLDCYSPTSVYLRENLCSKYPLIPTKDDHGAFLPGAVYGVMCLRCGLEDANDSRARQIVDEELRRFERDGIDAFRSRNYDDRGRQIGPIRQWIAEKIMLFQFRLEKLVWILVSKKID